MDERIEQSLGADFYSIFTNKMLNAAVYSPDESSNASLLNVIERQSASTANAAS